MEQKEPVKDVIVLNRMFNGGYLKEGNIGHEVINIYKSDKGENYIYLTKSGKIAQEYKGRIGCVLLVRGIGHSQLEVIGKTVGELEEIYGNYDQKEYIENSDIRYGGVLLSDIFKDNKSHQTICITFKAENVLKPKKPVYLQYGNDTDKGEIGAIPLHANQAKQSLRQHISAKDNECDYKRLYDIINDDDLWGDEVGYVDTKESSNFDNDLLDHTIFDICGITHYELAHSKAIGNLLKSDREFAGKFFKEVLGLEEGIVGDYTVEMETKYRIDIFITDDVKSIIIENKIKSGINGMSKDPKTGEIETQLERYLRLVKNEEEKGKENEEVKQKDIYSYLLSPDYNDIKDDSKEARKGYYKEYKKILYSKLYKLMTTYPAYKKDTNFTIITDAFKRHTLSYDNKLYSEMKKLFLERLKSLIEKVADKGCMVEQFISENVDLNSNIISFLRAYPETLDIVGGDDEFSFDVSPEKWIMANTLMKSEPENYSFMIAAAIGTEIAERFNDYIK